MFPSKRKEIQDELRIPRFCPNCGKLVEIKFRKRVLNQDHYDCKRCERQS